MEMKTTKVGIVGCGMISDTYFKASQKFRNLEVIACSDIIPERSAKKHELYGVANVTNEELFANPEIEVVINLTPPQVHSKIAIDTLNAGKHAYSEKPFGVDFEDAQKVIRLAKEIGFFSTTVTTNATMPFRNIEADSIWVSMDGVGKYHDAVRGAGMFDRLVENVRDCGHPALSVNMVVSRLNYESLDEAMEFVRNNPHIRQISINFLTPYPGSEDLMLDPDIRSSIIDKVIDYKKKGYPIMNSVSGLKMMKKMDFRKYCWVSNFITVDGVRHPDCGGSELGLCDRCGFCMSGEMYSVMHLKPDTLLAGLNLRM